MDNLRNIQIAGLWKQYTTDFPTSESVLEALVSRSTAPLTCQRCGVRQAVQEFNRRWTTCDSCGKRIWITGGGFFHSVKRPAAWLGAIYVLEHGININACELKEIAGIAYATAWTILQRLAAVMTKQLPQGASSHCSEFVDVIARRSVETGKLAHPSDSVHEFKVVNSDSSHLLSQLQDEELQVLSLLSDKPVYFDTLVEKTEMPVGLLSSTLTMLELGRYIESRPGGSYVRRHHTVFAGHGGNPVQARQVDDRLLETILQFIHRTFKGVSHKYLQGYASRFWCTSDRSRWINGALLEVCKQSLPIRDHDVRQQSSSAWVRLPPASFSMS